jgi:hypothetical protein
MADRIYVTLVARYPRKRVFADGCRLAAAASA